MNELRREINPTQIINNPLYQLYVNTLKGFAIQSSIPQSSIEIGRVTLEDAANYAAKLLVLNEAEKLPLNEERAFLLIGIAQGIITTPPNEWKPFLNTLKLLFIDQKTQTTHSRRVQTVSQLVSPSARDYRLFNPQMPNQLIENEVEEQRRVKEYLQNNLVSPEAQEQLEQEAKERITNLRKKLQKNGLVAEDEVEKKYSRRFVNATEKEMYEQIQVRGYTTTNENGDPVMYITKDLTFLEHEYMHTQFSSKKAPWSEGTGVFAHLITPHYGGYLFLGLMEALTEEYSGNPQIYQPQREVYYTMIEKDLQSGIVKDENLERLSKHAYKDETQGKARSDLVRAIVEKYGPKGLALIAMLSPRPRLDLAGPIEKAISLSPEKVKEYIKAINTLQSK